MGSGDLLPSSLGTKYGPKVTGFKQIFQFFWQFHSRSRSCWVQDVGTQGSGGHFLDSSGLLVVNMVRRCHLHSAIQF